MLLARESEMAADDPGDTVSFATVQIKEEKKKNCSLLWRRIGLVNTFTNNVVTNRQEGMNRQTRADAAGVVRAGMSEGLRSVRAR